MKHILKFAFLAVSISSVFLYGEKMFSFMLLTQDVTNQSYLLLEYGIMIGYIIFIVFIVLLQLRNYYHLMHYKPLMGKSLLICYQLSAAGFSMLVFIHYSFQKTIILVLSFLLITALFDTVRDKILSIQQGNIIHPKKIL
ncbi:MAG: hypothetical protein RBT45_00800 [Acholeplasmataceae bacterium]|nr:hypothetical protein [Acholeplasmataceae bacterium]